MSLKDAIGSWCGVRFELGRPDGCIRWFRIDALRNGFLIRFEDCAIFGSIIDGEAIRFDGEHYWHHTIKHADSKKIRQEWLIWEIARSMLERGERLNEEDGQRLALAVRRLEIWL